MTRSLPVPILALALACISHPSAAQEAGACMDEVDRLSAAFTQTQQGGGQASATAGTNVPMPSADQTERELARSGGVVRPSRIGEGIDIDRPSRMAESGSGAETAVPAPSVRKGASLDDAQRQRFHDLVGAARDAGRRGDGPGCVQRLGEARMILRQAAVGSVRPGGAAGGDAMGGTGGGTGAGGTAGSQGGGGSSTAGRGGMGAGTTGAGTSAIGPGGAGTTGGTGGGSMGGGSGGGSSGSGG